MTVSQSSGRVVDWPARRRFAAVYSNPILLGFGFIGYFGSLYAPVFFPLLLFALWAYVAWGIAIIQFSIGLRRVVTGKAPLGRHHVISALVVCAIYGAGYVLVLQGYVLTA